MNTKLALCSGKAVKLPARFSALALAALLVTAGGGSPAPAASLHISNTGANPEALPTFRLDWDASSNAIYLLQSASSLAPGSLWNTLDAVPANGLSGSYQLQVPASDSTGLPSPPATYYRLILPQPQIFAVEPAVVAPGAPVDFYVLGQCFDTNLTLLINGVTQSGVLYQGSTTLVKPTFTPGTPGTYLFQITGGGQVLSSFTVTCADAVANPELVLQGPPSEPPASPAKKDFKGHVTLLKAFDDGSGDSEGKKDFKGHVTLLKAFDDEAGGSEAKKDFKGHVTLLKAFDDESDNSSARTHTKTGHVTLMKRFDDGSSARTHTKTGHVTLMKAYDDGGDDVQESKKGLNAVNVKLASRVAGDGGGGGGGSGPLHMPALMKAKEKANQTKMMETSGDGETGSLLMPALMKAKEKANQTKMVVVKPFSGEVQACDVDLAIAGRGIDFIWARTYNSRIGRFGTASNGWTFSYDVRCVLNSSGGFDVYDGTGRKDAFSLQGNGSYTCPEFFCEGALGNNAFTLTFADTGRWVFHSFDGSTAAGKLIQIITRNGDTMTLGYDTGGRLVQIVDDLGRTNTMGYNGAGQLASVSDFSGRSVTYQYYQGAVSDKGSAGDLQSVTSPPVTGTPNGNDFSSGKTTTYTYSKSFASDRDNHLLLTIIDPKGQTEATFTYEHATTSTNYLRCVTAQEGTNTPSCFNWVLVSRPSGSYATTKCIANDPVGNVAEYFFDARNRCVIEDDYTGRATPGLVVTDSQNRPTGRLRAGDPVSFETRWNWNNDSLCTLAVAPSGQQVQCVYQSDFDSSTSARKRADCRVVRELAGSPVDLDGDGVAETTNRTWHFDYDPRFGRGFPARDYCVQYRESDFDFASRLMEEEGIYYYFSTTGRHHSTAMDPFPDPPNCGVAYHAINTKGTGVSGVSVATRKAMMNWIDSGARGLVPGGNGMAIKTKGTGADHNRASSGGDDADGDLWPDATSFVTSSTDPRGVVSTATYDATGNLRSYVPAPVITIEPAIVDAFAYNAQGQLTAITNAPDANGRSRVDTFSYYTNGPRAGYLQACVVDANGLTLTTSFDYDARGNVTRVIDPRNNDCLMVYNALDECVQSQSPLLSGGGASWRITTQCAYDANDNFVQSSIELRDAFGTLQGSRTDNFQYDVMDRLSQSALAVDASHALTNRYAYDGNDQCVQVLGGDAVSGAVPSQTVSYQYDERGLLYRRIFGAGATVQSTDQFGYTLNGRLGAANGGVEQPGFLYTYTYDGFDRLATVTDPMGNQTVCFHDANDNLRVMRQLGELNDVPGSAGNVRLTESQYDYDAVDRCVRSRDLFFNPATQSPVGNGRSQTTYAYAPNDECLSVTDPLGHATTYAYDTVCRPLSVTDAVGNQQSVVYDACANPLVFSSSEIPAAGGNPQVLAVTNVYDSLNRRVRMTDSAGNSAVCAYDSLGRCIQSTDPRGTLSFYTYDLLDRCTSAVLDLDHDGLPDFTGDITTTCTWSPSSGNLLATTDSLTNTSSYAYDPLGRCVAITRPDGTQELMIWSPRSNLLGEQDPNGTTITNTFDACNRVLHRDVAARNVLATTTSETFAYDGCSRLISATNDNSAETFAYDSLGDCVSETLGGLATTSTYDACRNRLTLTYPGGRALSYTYDTLNRCATINAISEQEAGFGRDGDRLSLITYGNGTRTQIAYDGFAGIPNGQGDSGFGRVSRVRHSVINGGTIIDDRTFAYDADQDKTLRDLSPPFTLGGIARAQSFQYDPACRLVNSLLTTNGVFAQLVTYSLDRMGNRTNVTGAACSGAYTLSSLLPPGDFQMNQYTATPCDSRTYDDNGNLAGVSTSAGPRAFQYDYADRLVQVQVLDSGTGTLVPAVSFTYDALGRRITKTVYNSGLPPATTQYLYDCDGVIEERSGGVVTATYVLRKDDPETDKDCGGACVAMTRNGKEYFLHTDDQGNTLALTTTGGAVVERYDCDDYGDITFYSGNGTPTGATTSAVGNPYLWRGQRLDPETGLHNDDGGNYFEPQTGRAIRGKVKTIKDMGNGRVRGIDGNNPWSSGGAFDKTKPVATEPRQGIRGTVSVLK